MNRRKVKVLIVLAMAVLMAFAMSNVAFGATVHKYSPYKTGKIVEGPLNVRASASTKAKVYGAIDQGKKITLTGYVKKNGHIWYRMTYSGSTAFVSGDYVKKVKSPGYVIFTPIKYGKVKEGPLNVRAKASTSSDIRTSWEVGKKFKIYGYKTVKGTKWYRVRVNGKAGYVAAEYVKKISYASYSKKKSSGGGESVGGSGSTICSFATSLCGCPYVYGAAGPSSFDCSGFTMYVFSHFGIGLSHSSYAQMNAGRGVSTSEMQPGDLVIYNGGGHVGIYIGGGMIVHASSTHGRVVTESVNYRPIVCVRRVL